MQIREANKKDLVSLLQLYTQLHDNPMPKNSAELTDLWTCIIQDENHHIVLIEKDDKVVSSCVLIVVLNLTRNQRPYAFIENVITDKAYRKQGLATACLDYAREIANQQNCYKIMLMTGSKEDSTLNFYRKAGYNLEDKTAFIQWL